MPDGSVWYWVKRSGDNVVPVVFLQKAFHYLNLIGKLWLSLLVWQADAADRV